MRNIFKKELSVVVPAYNEEENITILLRSIATSLKNAGFSYEVIVVDDHSTDKTTQKIKKVARKFHTKVIFKKGKKGKAYSLIEGFSKSRFENLAFIDADLQYPPEELPKMALKLKDFDIVSANRKRYKDNFARKVLSTSFRIGFGKLLFNLNYDIQAGLKVFKKEVLTCIPFRPSSPWTFDLEFLYYAREAGFSISNHDITFERRKKGTSKVGIIKSSLEIGTSSVALRLADVLPRKIAPSQKSSMRGAGVRYKRNKYITHTTLPYDKSSIRTFSRFQKFLIALSVELTVLGLVINPIYTLTVIVGFLSFIYFADTLFNFYVIFKSLRHPQEITFSKKALEQINTEDLPIYTILCPLYKEAHVIAQFIRNIKNLSWPQEKLDVILLLEEDDEQTIDAARKMSLPSFVRTIVVPHSQPKTKPKACNYGLSYARGEYLVIYDAEDKPESDQLKKAYLGFKKAKKDVVCLQAKLNYYNPFQNLLTRFFTAEYSLWFDVTLTGLQSINTSIPLGGTSNHFKTKDLLRLQGWDPFNVTEDADLGMRLFKDGYKTAMIDSVTLEEANSMWGNWLRQRSRWIKGYMQTYLVHTRDSVKFAKDKGLHFPIFHLIIGGKIAFILINPFLWAATISYFSLYAFVGPTIEKLYPTPVFYMAVFSLVFGNFLFMYYYMIGTIKREQYSLVKYVFLVPFYWFMISIAGFVALYQLFFKPFYWEKTVHGLYIAKPKEKTIVKPAIPPITIPRPAVSVAWILRASSNPLIAIGNIERWVIRAFAVTLIFIGEVEKRTLKALLAVFRKAVVAPLKYASSIIS